MPGGWKMGVRARSDGVLADTIGDIGIGEAGGEGVEGGGEKTPFIDDGDVGSGICAGGTCSGCSPGPVSGSDPGAGF